MNQIMHQIKDWFIVKGTVGRSLLAIIYVYEYIPISVIPHVASVKRIRKGSEKFPKMPLGR